VPKLNWKFMRIALGQINPTVGDLAGNVALCARFAKEAAERGRGADRLSRTLADRLSAARSGGEARFHRAIRSRVERLAAETATFRWP
jgi:hypothetical protein